MDRVEEQAKASFKAAGAGAFVAGAVVGPSALNIAVLNGNFSSEIEPLAMAMVMQSAAENGGISQIEAEALASATVATAAKANETTIRDVFSVLGAELAANDDLDISLKLTLALLLLRTLIGKRRSQREKTVSFVVTSAWNAGAVAAAEKSGRKEKIWLSRDDQRVRSAHRILDGQKQPLGEPFVVAGVPIRFPGDPAAPVALTINCRCRLRFA